MRFDELFIYFGIQQEFDREICATIFSYDVIVMRHSNCSAPILPPGSPGVRQDMRVIKKGGALEKRVIFVAI